MYVVIELGKEFDVKLTLSMKIKFKVDKCEFMSHYKSFFKLKKLKAIHKL